MTVSIINHNYIGGVQWRDDEIRASAGLKDASVYEETWVGAKSVDSRKWAQAGASWCKGQNWMHVGTNCKQVQRVQMGAEGMSKKGMSRN